MAGKHLDYSGQKFGRLTCLVFSHFDSSNNSSYWECQCDCGSRITARISKLKNGTTLSCGCIRKDKNRNRLFKHGETETKLFTAWQNMKQRCNNPQCAAYKDYGGRGIKVWKEWEKDYTKFRDYAVNLPHYGEEERSIDRIDNDGNYMPGNIRWATAKEQSNNRRKRGKNHGSYKFINKSITEDGNDSIPYAGCSKKSD